MSRIIQRAFYETLSGKIYTILPHEKGCFYVSWLSSPYEHDDGLLDAQSFDDLISSGDWVELGGFENE